jgi:hypothetical protein
VRDDDETPWFKYRFIIFVTPLIASVWPTHWKGWLLYLAAWATLIGSSLTALKLQSPVPAFVGVAFLGALVSWGARHAESAVAIEPWKIRRFRNDP